MTQLIDNATLITPSGTLTKGWLLLDKGRIAVIGEHHPPPADDYLNGRGDEGWVVLPGYIDIHVHGSIGCDTMNGTPEALAALSTFFASKGVTGWLATTVTNSDAATHRALENVAAHMGKRMPGAAVLGAHREGPYINMKAKGAQNGAFVRPADPAEYERWLATGAIRLTTVAPEIEANRAFIRACLERGIVVSIGHTQATYEEALAAFDMGISHATHTFNAMTPLHHRKPGVVGAVLTDPRITCEIIPDLFHVHGAMVSLVAAAKGSDQVALITDAIAGAGMSDGIYDLGGQAVTVRNGEATLADGTLAGSIVTMDQAVRNARAVTGLDWTTISRMASATPARQAGYGGQKGMIRVDYDADLILLDSHGEIQITIVGGNVVYQRKS